MDTKTKKRKVVKSGQALIITLPADFVRSSGLKKGDTVGVTYDSILVIVKPELPKEKSEEKRDEEDR
jgi:antitoxin component of MazEF toxin-antitoxin module